jgi:hypothetical protein
VRDGEDGICRRYPKVIRRQAAEWCWEFKALPPSEEVLKTDLIMLQLSKATHILCASLHAKTVEDVLLLGRVAFACSGSRNSVLAIYELSRELKKVNVEW